MIHIFISLLLLTSQSHAGKELDKAEIDRLVELERSHPNINTLKEQIQDCDSTFLSVDNSLSVSERFKEAIDKTTDLNKAANRQALKREYEARLAKLIWTMEQWSKAKEEQSAWLGWQNQEEAKKIAQNLKDVASQLAEGKDPTKFSLIPKAVLTKLGDTSVFVVLNRLQLMADGALKDLRPLNHGRLQATKRVGRPGPTHAFVPSGRVMVPGEWQKTPIEELKLFR